MPDDERLSYGAVFDALRALWGPVADERPPSERALPFRGSSLRGIAPLLDVFAPPSPRDDRASIILVHGGGFFIGSRQMKPVRLVASRLSARGFYVASVDYRMILRGGRLDESVDDVLTALTFWRGECVRRGLESSRVSMLGLSAGATLTLLAAAHPKARPHRVISCFGLYELNHLGGPLAALLPRLLFQTANPAEWAARSPRGAPQTSSPTMLLHGTADGLVPVEQARRLDAHRRALGLPTSLVELGGAPHGFFNHDDAHARAALDAIITFLDGG